MAFCSFVGEIYDIESNPFIYATIAACLLAVVLLIVAVISLIMLCKQRSDNKRSYLPLRSLIYYYDLLTLYCMNNESSDGKI